MKTKYILTLALLIAATGVVWLLVGALNPVPQEDPQQGSNAAPAQEELTETNLHDRQWFNLSAPGLIEKGEVSENRPAFWPKELEQSERLKKAGERGPADCVVRNYNFDINQTVGDNVGNLRDAEVHCNVKVLEKLP